MSSFGYWGPITVERLYEIERRKFEGKYRCLRVGTGFHSLTIYVSPMGRTVRVFKNGKELRP